MLMIKRLVGFGTVVAALPAFEMVRAPWCFNLADLSLTNPRHEMAAELTGTAWADGSYSIICGTFLSPQRNDDRSSTDAS
jgi:hypothetical protein